MPRIRIRTPDGERIVGTPNCSTLTVQLVSHAQRPGLQLRADATLTAGERVLQCWTWDFGELDSRSTVELMSEPGDRFDPPDASYEPREATIPDQYAHPDVNLEAATREFQRMTEALERMGARKRSIMQPSKQDVGPITHLCAFCGRGQDEVRKLIAGPSVAICGECISAAAVLAGEK